MSLLLKASTSSGITPGDIGSGSNGIARNPEGIIESALASALAEIPFSPPRTKDSRSTRLVTEKSTINPASPQPSRNASSSISSIATGSSLPNVPEQNSHNIHSSPSRTTVTAIIAAASAMVVVLLLLLIFIIIKRCRRRIVARDAADNRRVHAFFIKPSSLNHPSSKMVPKSKANTSPPHEQNSTADAPTDNNTPGKLRSQNNSTSGNDIQPEDGMNQPTTVLRFHAIRERMQHIETLGTLREINENIDLSVIENVLDQLEPPPPEYVSLASRRSDSGVVDHTGAIGGGESKTVGSFH